MAEKLELTEEKVQELRQEAEKAILEDFYIKKVPNLKIEEPIIKREADPFENQAIGMLREGLSRTAICETLKITPDRLKKILKQAMVPADSVFLKPNRVFNRLRYSYLDEKVNPQQWPMAIGNILDRAMGALLNKLSEEVVHANVSQLSGLIGNLIDKYRLLAGQSTENVFNVNINSDMTSEEMLAALTGIREKNVIKKTQNEEAK